MIEGAVETVPDALYEQLAHRASLRQFIATMATPSGVATCDSTCGRLLCQKAADARAEPDEFAKEPDLYFASGSN